MRLIVGLGNPGSQYDNTRHNVGFVVLDRLARRHVPADNLVARSKFQGTTLEANIGGEKVVLLKPLTFMNRSGQSVAEAVGFFKLDASKDLLVIVDDVALPCGAIRVRGEGSSGGHNGLADIEQKLSTAAYPRLRIGIDAPGQIPQKEYVLGRFRQDQLQSIDQGIEDAVSAAVCWASEGIATAMNRFNKRDVQSVQTSKG